MMNHNINAAAVTAAAQGQWREILTANGINLPSGRHQGPCPICLAGKDRFRFDDKEGRGTWLCNQCGKDGKCGAGDGLDLYKRATGQTMSEAIRCLAGYLGLSGQMTPADHARNEKRRQEAAKAVEEQQQKEARQREAAAALANLMADEALIIDAAEHPYLKRKGYAGFPVFTLARTYHHEVDGKQYSYRAGCLLHSIRDNKAEIISAELVTDGGRKTTLAGGSKAGVFIVEPPVDMPIKEVEHLFICEGVATGYAIREIFGFKALGFAALTKNNMARSALIAHALVPELPIIVCADVGAEREAEQAAASVNGMVSAPPSDDWDTYRQQQGVAA
ncbi:primase-helicase zinc-binding domain-containing protein [Aeromonas veronii]|uniref:primase-helicase zinc-binding domain-containing protein n=1 Tax=Aeromonas veronii TaxID=654 RepID=UPI003A1433CE